MSAGVNKVIVLGRLGQAPEVKATPSGTTVANFSLAVNQYNGKTKAQETEWIRCVAWGKTAEAIGKFCDKGDLLYGEGRLQTRSWEKDGQKQFRTEVVLLGVQFLSNKRGEGQDAPSGSDDSGDVPF